MKKNILINLLSFTACFFATTIINAQKTQTDTIISESLIKESINRFVSLVDSEDVQEYGLKSIAELKSLRAGKQYRKYVIGLNDIKKFKAGDDVAKIIKEYPSIEVSLVNKSGKIITSIEFVKKDNKWEASGYGSTPELISLGQAQTKYGNGIARRGNLIRIPALGVSFISIPSAAGLEFMSLEDNQKYKLQKGIKTTASSAILKLVPFANNHNGLPG